jgi:hypothetical protein
LMPNGCVYSPYQVPAATGTTLARTIFIFSENQFPPPDQVRGQAFPEFMR